MQYTISSN